MSSDTTKIIKPVSKTEAALREAGYQSPNCRPISEDDWKELDAQIAYLRGQSPTCPTVSSLQDCDDESEGNALACASVIVLGTGIGLGAAYLFWCLL